MPFFIMLLKGETNGIKEDQITFVYVGYQIGFTFIMLIEVYLRQLNRKFSDIIFTAQQDACHAEKSIKGFLRSGLLPGSQLVAVFSDEFNYLINSEITILI